MNEIVLGSRVTTGQSPKIRLTAIPWNLPWVMGH